MADGIEIRIRPEGSTDMAWTSIGTLAPGATFQFGSGVSTSKLVNSMYIGKEPTAMHPGTLTLADANGNAITIEPTGQNGYTVHTSPDPVRVNSKMDEALRGHAVRCLNYAKPKPVAELEA